MNFTKMVNSKLNAIADWIIRLVMINILIIFFSLPMITIYPAVSAGYNVFNDYINNKNPKMFKDYFKYFKEGIVKKLLLSLIIGIIVVVGALNMRYYSLSMETSSSAMYIVGFYVTLALSAMVYVTVLYTFTVIKIRPDIKIIHLFKTAFYLAGKFYFVSMLLVVSNSLPILLLMWPQTILFFIIMGVAIPVCLNAVFTKQAYLWLERAGDQNDSMRD